MAAVGVISFLLISFTLPLNGLLGNLNPKASSHAIVNTNIYWGAFAENVPDDLSNITTLETDVGKKVAIISWYQGWAGPNATFDTTGMDLIRSHGSIPMITWEPWDTTTDINPSYSLSNIAKGNFDSYLTQYAKDAKTWGHPFFLRLAPEMNGNWNSWSEGMNGNQTGDYVQAWKHVHDLFAANNVTNVTWVWCPNADFTGSIPVSELYPGDNYVDWTCIDGYNWGGVNGIAWQSFSQVFQPTYNEIETVAPAKPLMIGEMGSAETGAPAGESKASWITDALQTQIPENFPQLKAMIWFNTNKETNWLIESSPTSQQAFAAAVKSPYYIDNQFLNLTSSIIQPFMQSVGSPLPTQIPMPSLLSMQPLPTLVPGDINDNGRVDIFDYNILIANFNKSGVGIAGDINNNNKVDIFDYNILVSDFGKQS